MRCFIAVDLDPFITRKIELLQEELVNLDTKLVEPHNLHFTLKFLGEVDEDIVNGVKTMLKETANDFKPFVFDIKDTGVFPNENFIRVVWIGGEKLNSLQLAINDSLSKLFKKEKPSPHLTIARVRTQRHRKEIINFIERHKYVKIGEMLVKTIKLKRSIITSKGSVYEDLAAFRLGSV